MATSIRLQHLSDGKWKDCITFLVSTLGLLFIGVIIVLLSRPEQIQRQIRFHPGFHPVLPCHHVLPARHCFFEPSDPCFTIPPSPASIEWWTDKVQAVSRYDANRQLRGLRARICAGDGWDLGLWDLWVHNWTAEWTVSPTCTSTNRIVFLHHQVHAYANKCKHITSSIFFLRWTCEGIDVEFVKVRRH